MPVAAVFELLEAPEKHVASRLCADVADDPAHVIDPFGDA